MHSATIDVQHLLEAVGETLEAMAFVSLLPVESPPELPSAPVFVQIQFKGHVSGALELAAPVDFGKAIVLGATGGDSRSAPSELQAHDALQELMNVAAGAMLRTENEDEKFDISLPTTPVPMTDTQWIEFVESGRAAVVEAEGSIIALGVMLSE